jgi:hypothetical protein
VPKATIHFKPLEFLGKPQPNLDEFPNDAEHGNPDPSTAYQYMKSTAYDFAKNGRRFMWEGRECVILSVSGRGIWSSEGKGKTYKEAVDQWITENQSKEQAKAEAEKPAAPAYAY